LSTQGQGGAQPATGRRHRENAEKNQQRPRQGAVAVAIGSKTELGRYYDDAAGYQVALSRTVSAGGRGNIAGSGAECTRSDRRRARREVRVIERVVELRAELNILLFRKKNFLVTSVSRLKKPPKLVP
jgi:phosphoribosylaminoimidazole carboxylase (NCAIR synthetase)